MYGYASEIFPYLQQLFGGGDMAGDATGQSDQTMSSDYEQPTGLLGGSKKPTRPAKKPASSAAAPRGRPSAPTPPRRPADLGQALMAAGQRQTPQSRDASIQQFLMSQGIGQPQPQPQMPFPQIDRGPAPQTPQGPTWTPNQPADVPTPPVRPEGLGPQWAQPQAPSPVAQPQRPAWLDYALQNYGGGQQPQAAPPSITTGANLPPVQGAVMRSNNPMDNLPKGQTAMSEPPDLGAKIRSDMAAEAGYALPVARALLTKNPLALASMFDHPNAVGPSGPSTPAVQPAPKSYFQEGGNFSQPSLSEYVDVTVRQNPREFYAPWQEELLGNARSAMRNPFLEPYVADRPNYGASVGPNPFLQMKAPGLLN